MVIKKALLVLSLILIGLETVAQVNIPGTYLQRKNQSERLASDSSTHLTYSPSVYYAPGNKFQILNPFTQLSYNSAYPRGYNDGPMWKGKGITQEFHAGIQFKKGLLNVTLYPLVYFSQNSAFRLASINPDQNPYSYQFGVSRNVDFVQRYGNSSFAKFHPGQSEVALRHKKFQLALSTQNFTLGPALHNHIIMSNSGPGFPHLILGTPEKVELKFRDIELGKLEVNLFYGLLNESKYFDTLSGNNRRYLNGLAIGYEVPYIKGLTIGFQRTMYKNTEYFESADLYSMFFIKDNGIITAQTGDTVKTGNDTFDQLASAYIEWKLADKDLRLYFEFARNDFNGSLRTFITEFEHSRAYTLGFEKMINLKSDNKVHLGYEHTFLPRYMSYQYRPNPPFYTHHIAIQGYTQDGQMIGAGIGPGSVSDIFTLNWLGEKRNAGMSMQRIRFDEDYFISKIPDTLLKLERHDIELTLGINYSKFAKYLNWGFQFEISHRYNMYFEHHSDKTNFAGRVFAQYLINNN